MAQIMDGIIQLGITQRTCGRLNADCQVESHLPVQSLVWSVRDGAQTALLPMLVLLCVSTMGVTAVLPLCGSKRGHFSALTVCSPQETVRKHVTGTLVMSGMPTMETHARMRNKTMDAIALAASVQEISQVQVQDLNHRARLLQAHHPRLRQAIAQRRALDTHAMSGMSTTEILAPTRKNSTVVIALAVSALAGKSWSERLVRPLC